MTDAYRPSSQYFFFVWGGVVVLRELKSIGFVSGNLAYMDGASSLVDIFKKEKWY